MLREPSFDPLFFFTPRQYIAPLLNPLFKGGKTILPFSVLSPKPHAGAKRTPTPPPFGEELEDDLPFFSSFLTLSTVRGRFSETYFLLSLRILVPMPFSKQRQQFSFFFLNYPPLRNALTPRQSGTTSELLRPPSFFRFGRPLQLI